MPDQEFRIELDFPMVRATFGTRRAEAPFSVRFEQNFLLTVLDEFDDYRPEFRERLLLPVGQQLFEALFPPPVLALYLRARAGMRQKGRSRLVIRVVSSNPRLLTLPWEFMYDVRHGVFPATALETPVVRTCGDVAGGVALRARPPLRILLAGASPDEEPPLNYEDELGTIQRVARQRLAEVRVLLRATARGIEESVERFKPHILHIVAHGYATPGTSGIHLDDGAGYTHRVSADRIVGWFSGWRPDLVVLNACESARLDPEAPRGGLPLALQEHVPAVVAMQYRVPDEAGVSFGRRFYEALFSGLTLEEAVQSARHTLLVGGGLLQRHFATPVLYLACERGGRLREVSHPSTDRTALVVRQRRSPFKYLDAFSREERALFFGRTEAIESLVTLIATHRLSVVHGASGVGKTSLLNAGLAQSIAESLYSSVTLRVMTDAVRGLVRAIGALEPQDAVDGCTACHWNSTGMGRSGPVPPLPVDLASGSAEEVAKALARRIRHVQSVDHRTLLLVLDQFEEVVTLLDEEERTRFLDILERLFVDPSLRLRIVLVVRDDFLAELDRFKRWFPGILSNRYRLAPLSESGAREALEGPLNMADWPFERELVDRIVRDLGGEQVDPSSLQIVGHILVEEATARGDETLTLRRYHDLGGAGGLMELHLGRIEKGLSSSEKSLLYRILHVFVGSYGTRRPVDRTLLSREVNRPWQTLEPWLTHLEKARVIRRAESQGNGEIAADLTNPVWELSHEVLIKAVERRAEVLGFRSEVARLIRRMWALGGISTILASLILWVVVSYLGARYSFRLHLVAPHPGKWHYHLNAGQETCRDFQADGHDWSVDGTFTGQEKSWWALPVGTYEVRLEETTPGVEQATPIRFAVRLEGFGNVSVTYPPDPVVTFRGLEMVYIPGGEITVGDTSMAVKTKPAWAIRRVTVDPFYIGRYEVTQEQYLAYLEAVGSAGNLLDDSVSCIASDDEPALRPDPGRVDGEPDVPVELWPKLPVVDISVDEARAYAAWLTRQSGGRYHFRLPTQEEWELAARGVDGREFPWGNCFSYKGEWSNWMSNASQDPYNRRAPVGSFQEYMSPYGILDMAGNVSEFTAGCGLGVSDDLNEGGEVEPSGEDCPSVILRGGNHTHLWYDAIAARVRQVPRETCSTYVGFRLAMDVARSD